MLTESRQNLVQFLGTFAVAVLCGLAIVALQVPQLSQLRSQSRSPSADRLNREAQIESARLNLLEKMPSFGYDNLIADWTFMSFLQYFGDDPAREATDYHLSPDFFDVIVKRDPRFLEAYTFLSTSTAIYAAQPERSVALMNEGLKSLTPTQPPGSYLVWRNKAIDELLFLGDSAAARQSFETAADWADASGLPDAANASAMSRQTAAYLANNPDSRSAQISAWVMVLSNVLDDRTREIAVKRIQDLGGTITVDENGTANVQLPNQD
jgi:hypothetical protein